LSRLLLLAGGLLLLLGAKQHMIGAWIEMTPVQLSWGILAYLVSVLLVGHRKRYYLWLFVLMQVLFFSFALLVCGAVPEHRLTYYAVLALMMIAAFFVGRHRSLREGSSPQPGPGMVHEISFAVLGGFGALVSAFLVSFPLSWSVGLYLAVTLCCLTWSCLGPARTRRAVLLRAGFALVLASPLVLTVRVLDMMEMLHVHMALMLLCFLTVMASSAMLLRQRGWAVD
jgi:hypothetical protein